MPPQPVTVSLADLENDSIPLHTLAAAFGPDSLGILLVRDLPPAFLPLRQHVLSSASFLGNLPADQLTLLERPDANYLVGWSCGKETLRNGQVDTHKGSFYVDVVGDENVWPSLPGFEEAFCKLSRLVVDVAALVARACDRFAVQELQAYPEGYLERMVRGSKTNKARLLHYFPAGSERSEERESEERSDEREERDEDEEEDERSEEREDERSEEKKDERSVETKEKDDWCTTHVDHGCLTGLTSAFYVDESDVDFTGDYTTLTETDCPDPNAGLYVRSRNGETVQIRIPRDCIAFQTGEALERITQGQFKAVPHFVSSLLSDERSDERSEERKRSEEKKNERSEERKKKRRIARNTLAVFTQPNVDEIVDAVGRDDVWGVCSGHCSAEHIAVGQEGSMRN